MPLHIHFLRHGDVQPTRPYNSEKGYPDPPLSDLGQQQADRLGQRLQGQRLQGPPISKIYCSDLLRARQTAGIINTYLQLDITEDAALREIHMGDLHQKSWDDIERETPGVHARWLKHDWDMPYPRGECGADVKNRVMPVVRDIIRREEDHTAIVCHGGVIMILASFFLELPVEKRFRMRVDNCSISTVECHVDKEMFIVTCLNDTAHLAA
jgi:broad specificity phosphatase PhoE